MDQLPDELVLQIITLLPFVRDVVTILAVSKRLRKIAQDSNLWTQICFDDAKQRHRHLLDDQVNSPTGFIQHQANTALQISQAQQPHLAARDERAGFSNESTSSAERHRALANWDPSYPGEQVDWYAEYIARQSPMSISWLEPYTSDRGLTLESRGLGLYNREDQKVVAPMNDGTVCIWKINPDSAKEGLRGSLVAHSKPELLLHGSANRGSSSTSSLTSAEVVESVRIDSFGSKAFFALQKDLFEVDLNTLQISGRHTYPVPIAAISSTDDRLPTTVGTASSLHLHDHRQRRNHGSNDEEQDVLEAAAHFPSHFQDHVRNSYLDCDGTSEYNSLFQPGPSCIHHLTPWSHGPEPGEVYVAGRFPSILVYDRRTFPRLKTNFHSGSRLCSLTSLPYSFASLETELMSKEQLSVRESQEAKSLPGDRLIACGEYNGKGTLEIYGLSAERSSPSTQLPQAGFGQTSTMKNRVTASRSKLLSVVNHGTRILVSDSDSNLRWFERDGSSLVRAWNINQEPEVRDNGLFPTEFVDDGGEVARKLIPMCSRQGQNSLDADEVLLWTGERIGLLGFVKTSRFGGRNGEAWRAETFEEQMRHREERVYGEKLRRALQRQADETRALQGFGLDLDMPL